MPKRIITPYKGGREGNINARISAELKAQFTEALAKEGKTFGDWLEERIKQYLEQIKSLSNNQ